MAAEYLASVGVDLNALLSKLKLPGAEQGGSGEITTTPVPKIIGASLPSRPPNSRWDVSILNGKISIIEPYDPDLPDLKHVPGVIDADGALLAPSLCHAHVHLDKCFLLQDEKYRDLEITQGDFDEAMSITGAAKKRFEEEDLLRRGRRLIVESAEFGVTAMRAFAEVDEIVGMKCIDAALQLKEELKHVCDVQICAFAQLPIMSGEDGGERRRELFGEAIAKAGVDAVGSTPYVESDTEKMRKNVEWAVAKALDSGKHLDFHLDYNVDQNTEALVWFMIEELRKQNWSEKASKGLTISLGHCTRLTLFSADEWGKLKKEIGDLPVTFVGLPNSDMFMMGRPQQGERVSGNRIRGTLQVPEMIKRHGLRAAISINNVGNAFTPQGSCNPLSLACLGVGVYQAGTKQDTEILYETISSRAKEAIGSASTPLKFQEGDAANFVLFDSRSQERVSTQTLSNIVLTGGTDSRIRVIHRGKLLNLAQR